MSIRIEKSSGRKRDSGGLPLRFPPEMGTSVGYFPSISALASMADCRCSASRCCWAAFAARLAARLAFFSAVLVGVVFLVLNRMFFHLNAPDATIGALNSLYLNSNNIGLPIATYILGNPALVAPILVMQQAIFTPVGLTVLDVTTKGKVSIKEIAKQPLHQPLLIGSLLGIVVSAISAKSGWFPVPKFIFDPIDMIGDSAVPMILMAFGMSLHGTKPLQQKGDRPAIFTVAVLKNIIMPIIAFLLAYFVMGFRGSELYACVVLAALPTGQNVYNYAARYNVGLTFARDGILMSTMTSPVFIAIIAALLS